MPAISDSDSGRFLDGKVVYDTDSGSAAESASFSLLISDTDAFTGAESAVIHPGSLNGTGTRVSDAGLATDGGESAVQTTPPPDGDSGTLTDSSVSTALTDTDTGTLTDTGSAAPIHYVIDADLF